MMVMTIAQALARVPDEPRWVDVRGMLLSGRATVRAGPADVSAGFVVIVADVSLAAIVGSPRPDLISESLAALEGDVNVLVQHEDAAWTSSALPGCVRRTAVLHVLPGVMPWEAVSDPSTRVFTRTTAPRLDHVPDPLRKELLEALRGRTTARFVPGALPNAPDRQVGAALPIAAAWAGPRPVSFCYPVWQTERWWDVSIDTLEACRRRGYAQRAARAMIRHLRAEGRAPVWGAVESNTASRGLAARLGFIEAAGLSVFTLPRPDARTSAAPVL